MLELTLLEFAQVEWVATLATLLRNHVAEPVPLAGESLAQARQRALEVVKDTDMELLLQMRHPEKLAVVWKERSKL